jgi:hypothetical protein
MNRLRWTGLALACLLAACVRTSEGVPVPAAGPAETVTATPPATARPTEEADLTAPGVIPTTRKPVPAGTVACSHPNLPPVAVTAEVADRAAPKITVAVPDRWSATMGSADVGAKLDGPQGMWASVTIAKTRLDPAEAFRKYAADAMAVAAVSSVSIMPADLCGYSGQKLLGAWSDSPQQAVEFADRIAHIWTNTADYLVAVHVQAPTGTAGFGAASAVLMEDFTIVLP